MVMSNITLESLIAEAQNNQSYDPANWGEWGRTAEWLQSKLDPGEQIVAIPAELAGALREWRRWHFPDDHDSRGYEQDLAAAIDRYFPKDTK
jgi:hypothetical protein